MVDRTIKLNFQPPIPKQGQIFVRDQLDMPVSEAQLFQPGTPWQTDPDAIAYRRQVKAWRSGMVGFDPWPDRGWQAGMQPWPPL